MLDLYIMGFEPRIVYTYTTTILSNLPSWRVMPAFFVYYYTLQDKEVFQVNEYVNGECTGYFMLNKFECQQKSIRGTWISTDGKRQYDIVLNKQ